MGLHLVLVEPEIHWNTGNAGRTALAVDATLHLVEPLGFLLDDKHLKRAGLDYWPRVRVHRWPSWHALAAELPLLGEAWFFSARATRSYWEPRYARDTVLVFGRESSGLSSTMLDAIAPQQQLAIPMAADAPRSLNLSTAVAVAAFEVMRQRSP